MTRTQLLRFAVTTAAVFLVASLLDHWSYSHLIAERVNSRDWGRMLRTFGYLPFWLAMGLALALHDGGEPGATRRFVWRRALLLMGSPIVGGIVAELLKMTIRRERPEMHDGAYGFRAWSDHPFRTSDLGLPSSHAVVAFAGAAILARLFPRARPVWYALAAGTALSRVLARAHFLSDVTLGACVGYGTAAVLWYAVGRRPNGATA